MDYNIKIGDVFKSPYDGYDQPLLYRVVKIAGDIITTELVNNLTTRGNIRFPKGHRESYRLKDTLKWFKMYQKKEHLPAWF